MREGRQGVAGKDPEDSQQQAEGARRTVRSSSGRSADTEDLLGDLRIASHTGDCPYGCPVCAAIGIVRQMSPDVTHHLAAAAREFVLAAKAFLDGVAERDASARSNVEHIDVD